MTAFRSIGVREDGTRGTQAAEVRKGMAGLFAPSSLTGSLDGILPAPGSPLTVTGTAGWTYNVNGGHVATSRSDSDGTVLFGNDGTTATAAVSAAPGSGSRWDLIYIRHQDIDAGGGETSEAGIGVVQGVSGGSPVKPTASLPAGAVVIAEAQVFAGATSTSHANVTITQVLGNTVARGGVLPVTTKTVLDTITGYEGMRAVTTTASGGYRAGQDWEWRSGAWVWPVAVQARLGAAEVTVAQTGIGTAQTDVTGLTAAITVPGTRRVRVTVKLPITIGTAAANIRVFVIRDGAIVDEVFNSGSIGAAGTGQQVNAVAHDVVAAGTYTYKVAVQFGANANNAVSPVTGATPKRCFMLLEDMGAA